MSNFNINPKIRLNKRISSNSASFNKAVQFNEEAAFHSQYSEMLEGIDKGYDFNKQSDLEKQYTITAYASIYSKVSNKLKDIIKSVDSIRYFYLVDVMLSQIAEDALSPKIGEEEIFKYSHQDESIAEELNEMKTRVGLDQLIENIAPDLLGYGEYTVKNEFFDSERPEDDLYGDNDDYDPSDGGIADVSDIVEQGTVVSITQDGKSQGYIVYDEAEGKIALKNLSVYTKFTMGGQRIKIDKGTALPMHGVQNDKIKRVISKIPRFIRTGRSVLYPVIPKIKELEILEKLIPATKLNKLSQGNLVGMNVPEQFDLKNAMEAVKRIEGMINKKVNVDPQTKELTVESILSTAGRTKVIPLFGDKGRLDTMNYRDNEPDDLTSSADELRSLILDSIGIPSELVFKSDGDSKADVLKRYAKYLRKLKRLQKALSQGLKHIACSHLSNKNIKFKEEDIEVVFNTNLVEIDNLDTLEHADATIGLLDSVKQFFIDLSAEDSPFKNMINLERVSDYLNDNLKAVGLADAIDTNVEKKKSGEPEVDVPETPPQDKDRDKDKEKTKPDPKDDEEEEDET